MRFSMQEAPAAVAYERVRVGDVYKSKGGNKSVFWLIVGITGLRAHAIGLDREGEIVSTTSYGVHAFADRELLGRCEGIDDFKADIEWRVAP